MVRLTLRWNLIILLLAACMCDVVASAMVLRKRAVIGDKYACTIDGLACLEHYAWDVGHPTSRSFCATRVSTRGTDPSGTERDGIGWVVIDDPFKTSLLADDGTLLGRIDVPDISLHPYFDVYCDTSWSSDGQAFVSRGAKREAVIPPLDANGEVRLRRSWIGFPLLLANASWHVRRQAPVIVGGILFVLFLTSGAMLDFIMPHTKGRCSRCRYSLHGNESGICPECGTFIAPERRAPSSIKTALRSGRVFIWFALAVLGFAILYAMGADGAYRITRGVGGCEPGPTGWIGVLQVSPTMIALMSLGPLSLGLALSLGSTLLPDPD